MVEGIDHDVLLHGDADRAQAGAETRLENEAEVVHEERSTAPGEIADELVALPRQIGGARVHVDHRGAIGGNRPRGRGDDLTDVVAEGLEGPPQPARAVGSHLDDGGGALSVAVPGHALEVGVELEVVDRVLVVAFHEADRRDPLAEDPEDPERDLVLVRARHLDPAAVGLEHGGVVDPHPVGVGDRRLRVGIDGADPKARVAPP